MNGTCALLPASEPLTGRRSADVRETGTGKDYACFTDKLSDYYPSAEKLGVVQDNLNTHSAGSFHSASDSEKASELTRKFGFHHTPIRAGWLNMVGIEISAIATGCLHRRIPDIETLRREVRICVGERNQQKAAVQWRFTENDARKKNGKTLSCYSDLN